MLTIKCEDHLQDTREFAQAVGAEEKLQKQLDYLATFACHDDPPDAPKTECVLLRDSAPHSFNFTMLRRTSDGTYAFWFNGGLIYEGPGQPLDGSYPALTVHIGSNGGAAPDWSIHT